MSLRGLSCLFFICFIGIGNAQKLIRPEPPKCQHLKKEGGENYASGDGGLDPNTMCNLHKKYSTPYTNCLCNWEKEHNAYEKQVKETRARIKVIKEANTLLQKEQRDISTTFNRSYVDLSSLKDESLFNREKNHQIKFYRKLISLEKKKKTTFFFDAKTSGQSTG